MYEKTIDEVIGDCDRMEVIIDGRVCSLVRGEEQFNAVCQSFYEMNKGGYEMPGYGVSIDSLTRQELKSGVWVRLVYPERVYRGEIPFESLLIKVDKEYCGYNLMREYEGKYQGRVFYFNLQPGKTMEPLYSLLCE